MSFSMEQSATMRSEVPEIIMLREEQRQSLPPAAEKALQQVVLLKDFLVHGPTTWQANQIIKRYLLPSGEFLSCVLWKNLFYISGTDIVRIVTYRLEAFGRVVHNTKKFEEGIFSDLRNLKTGTDASLEQPKSAFLDLLYKNNSIRTQKKQKVFFWYAVPHDRLFLDALERDLKRDRMVGGSATSTAKREPALSFVFDATTSLYDQYSRSLQHSSASEFGAALAAQQAQENMMANQPSAPMRFLSGSSGSSQPAQMYRSGSHSLSSGMTMDYGTHSLDSRRTSSQAAHHMLDADFAQPFSQGQCYTEDPETDFASYQLDLQPPMTEFDRGGQQPYRSSMSQHQPLDLDLEFADSSQEHVRMAGNGSYLVSGHNRMLSTGEEYLDSKTGNRQSFAEEGFTLPHDISGPTLTYANDNSLNHAPFRSTSITRAFPRNFSTIEGSPSYKQRRRRQSVASSLATVEQVHEAEGRHRDMTGTTPYQQSRPISEHQQMSYTQMNGTSFDPLASPLYLGASNDSFAALSYRQESETAEFDMSHSRGSSAHASSAPYPTKSFHCPTPGCLRTFKSVKHLRRHVETHAQDRPYGCNLCSKTFTEIDDLEAHSKSHTAYAVSDHSAMTHDYASRGYLNRQSMDSMSYSGSSNYSSHEFADSRERSMDPRALSIDVGRESRDASTVECFEEPKNMASFQDNQTQQQTIQDMESVEAAALRQSLMPESPVADNQAAASDHVGASSIMTDDTEGRESMSDYAVSRNMTDPRWFDAEATPRQEQFRFAGASRATQYDVDITTGANGTGLPMWCSADFGENSGVSAINAAF